MILEVVEYLWSSAVALRSDETALPDQWSRKSAGPYVRAAVAVVTTSIAAIESVDGHHSLQLPVKLAPLCLGGRQ